MPSYDLYDKSGNRVGELRERSGDYGGSGYGERWSPPGWRRRHYLVFFLLSSLWFPLAYFGWTANSADALAMVLVFVFVLVFCEGWIAQELEFGHTRGSDAFLRAAMIGAVLFVILGLRMILSITG